MPRIQMATHVCCHSGETEKIQAQHQSTSTGSWWRYPVYRTRIMWSTIQGSFWILMVLRVDVQQVMCRFGIRLMAVLEHIRRICNGSSSYVDLSNIETSV